MPLGGSAIDPISLFLETARLRCVIYYHGRNADVAQARVCRAGTRTDACSRPSERSDAQEFARVLAKFLNGVT